MAKGWFRIPGLRPDGDRTIGEQLLGLDPALAEAAGRSVLDLGCAEAAISLAFAKAGARRVLGIESLESHLEIARKLCAGQAAIELRQAFLQRWILEHEPPEQFDIVLALGIIHKLYDPGFALRWAARSAKDLLLFRAPAHAWAGVVKAKFALRGSAGPISVHVPTVMKEHGFALERHIPGARGEGVEYWRRRK